MSAFAWSCGWVRGTGLSCTVCWDPTRMLRCEHRAAASFMAPVLSSSGIQLSSHLCCSPRALLPGSRGRNRTAWSGTLGQPRAGSSSLQFPHTPCQPLSAWLQFHSSLLGCFGSTNGCWGASSMPAAAVRRGASPVLFSHVCHAHPMDNMSLYCHAGGAVLGGSSLPAGAQFGSIQLCLCVFSVCKHQTLVWRWAARGQGAKL